MEMNNQLMEVAFRIKEMREVCGFTVEDMAAKTDITAEQYCEYEKGTTDFPFSFIHKCALAFGVDMTDLLEGRSAKLSTYTVTRKGQGRETAKEDGIDIANLAPKFKDKLAEPYYVTYEYSQSQQNKPIHLTTHSGQEFDLVLSGKLKVQVGDHTEVLSEGDSIYYNSSTPHGMIAVGGQDCEFYAIVLQGQEKILHSEAKKIKKTTWSVKSKKIATISKKKKNSVTVKGKKAGNTKLTAKIKVGKKTYKKTKACHSVQ